MKNTILYFLLIALAGCFLVTNFSEISVKHNVEGFLNFFFAIGSFFGFTNFNFHDYDLNIRNFGGVFGVITFGILLVFTVRAYWQSLRLFNWVGPVINLCGLIMIWVSLFYISNAYFTDTLPEIPAQVEKI